MIELPKHLIVPTLLVLKSEKLEEDPTSVSVSPDIIDLLWESAIWMLIELSNIILRYMGISISMERMVPLLHYH